MIRNNLSSLPPQMISLSQKNDKWKKQCMDALENIGRIQISENSHLLENYQMIKGKFIFSHYFEKEDYQDLLSNLTKEFSIPVHLKHYDIISQVVNTLSGEYQKRPDLFKVRNFSETAKNNYSREKKRLLLEFVIEQINSDILMSLQEEGLDPQREDFSSEEEQNQYQQLIENRVQALTPPEIQRYMDMDWMDIAEIWAEHQISIDNEKFKRNESDRIQFEDMLSSDRAFKHFYIVPDGYNEEVWNTVNTFFHKSPEVNEIEKGDYVGRIFYLTLSEVINRYGYKLSNKDLLKLEKKKRQDYNPGNFNHAFSNGDFVGSVPGSVIPFQDYPVLSNVKTYLGVDPNNNYLTDYDVSVASGDEPAGYSRYGSSIFECTEVYWMSQQKIGRYTYPDSETGELINIIVDETFNYKMIPDIKIIESSYEDFNLENESNVLIWTWVNVCYKGIKINGVELEEPLYIDIRPNDYQFKGDNNIFGSKLPVCGQVFNNRNGESSSLVDLMKSDQIGHNVAMNQLYEIMQREIGRFALLDINIFPSGKDWGGEGNYDKFMMIAKQLGLGLVDTSSQNTKGSNFAHFQVIDLDESSRMMSRINIANFFEQKALSRVGITPQRLGSTTASESATGVQQAITQSFAQTESYFTRFSEYKKRCLQMSLDIAQYVQSQKIDISIMNLKSDASRSYIDLEGSDLTNAQLGLFIVDSQEITRQLETIRQLFITNNTSNASSVDLATVVFSNSPAEIKAQLATSERLRMEQHQADQQHESNLQQQQNENLREIEEMRIAKEDERLDKKLANDRYVAEVKAIATANIGQGMDTDESGIPDALEVQKFNAQINKNSEDILFKERENLSKERIELSKREIDKRKVALEKEKLIQEKELKEKEFKLKEKQMKNDLLKSKYADKGKFGE